MRKMTLALCGAALAACSNTLGSSSSAPAEYKIAEEGGAYVSDVATFESLGEKSATRGQKYKIVSLTGGATPPHYLVANITQYYGNKKGDEADGQLIFIKDGSATYDCKKYLTDLKISVANDDIPNVTCKFEVVGTLPLAQRAALKNA
jgi:hypothetical protein